MYCEIAPYDTTRYDCRKVYDRERRDVTRFPSLWVIPDKNNILNTDYLKADDILRRLQSHKINHRCVLKNVPLVQPGDPFKRIKDLFDAYLRTHLFQLDFDYYLTINAYTLSLDDRIAIILKELPWLKDIEGVWQLSSSAALDWIIKGGKHKDYSKRISVRFWGLAEQALTQAEWWSILQPLNIPGNAGLYDHSHKDNKGYFDKTLFNSTTPHLHFTAPPDLSALDGDIIHSNNDLMLTPGKRIDTSEMQSDRNLMVPVELTGVYKDVQFDKPTSDFDEIIYGTKPEELLPRLRQLNVRGHTNDILTRLYLMRASQDYFALKELTNELLVIKDGVYLNANLWDADWYHDPEQARNGLEAKEKWATEVLTNAFLAKDASIIKEFKWQTKTIRGKTITDTDIFGINQDGTYVFSCDTGMGKTSIIGRTVVGDCIDYKKKLIYITPLKSLTMGDAEELSKKLDYPIPHYLSNGSDPDAIREALQQDIVFCCYQGLSRYSNSGLDDMLSSFHTMIMDDAAVALGDGNLSEEDNENFQVFTDLCNTTKRKVFMDHDINQRHSLQQISLLTQPQRGKRVLYENTDSYNEGKNYCFFDDWYEGVLHTIETINEGKRVYINVDFSNKTDGEEHRRLQMFEKLIHKHCPGKKSIAYDTNNLPHNLRTSFAIELEKEVDSGLNFCIFSPAVGRGVSYLPDDKSKDFDLEMTFLASSHSNANTAFQGTGRPRRTIEHGVCFNMRWRPGSRRFNEKALKRYRNVNYRTTRKELRYRVTVADMQELLQSNPKNMLKYLLLHKRCNLFHIANEDGIYTKLPRDLEKTYKDIKKEFETDDFQEPNGVILRDFVAYDPDTQKYTAKLNAQIYLIDELLYKDIEKRHTFINKKTIAKYKQAMLLTPQQRLDWENEEGNSTQLDYVVQWGYLFDELLKYINPHMPGGCFLTDTISHTQTNVAVPIVPQDATELIHVIHNFYTLYQRMNPCLPAKAKECVGSAIRWFVRLFDYNCVINAKGDAVKQRDEIYEAMIKSAPGRFSQSDKLNKRTPKILEFIEQKIKDKQDLTDAEQNYYIRKTDTVFIIKRDTIATEVLYDASIRQWCDKNAKIA